MREPRSPNIMIFPGQMFTIMAFDFQDILSSGLLLPSLLQKKNTENERKNHEVNINEWDKSVMCGGGSQDEGVLLLSPPCDELR